MIKYPMKIPKEEIVDVKLWGVLLDQAHQHIFINRLVLQDPTRKGFSDSCNFGPRGFTHGVGAGDLK